MTLNVAVTHILRYFTEFGSFCGALRKSSRLLSHLLVSVTDKNMLAAFYGPRCSYLHGYR